MNSKTPIRSRKVVASIIAFLLAFSSACSVGKSKAIAERAVVNFHSQLDAGQYQEIYDQAGVEFQKAMSESDCLAFLQAVHQKLGTVKQSTQTSSKVIFSNTGTIISHDYDTELTNGKATETFSWRVKGDEAVLIG
jgi:hypothetical protein